MLKTNLILIGMFVILYVIERVLIVKIRRGKGKAAIKGLLIPFYLHYYWTENEKYQEKHVAEEPIARKFNRTWDRLADHAESAVNGVKEVGYKVKIWVKNSRSLDDRLAGLPAIGAWNDKNYFEFDPRYIPNDVEVNLVEEDWNVEFEGSDGEAV